MAQPGPDSDRRTISSPRGFPATQRGWKTHDRSIPSASAAERETSTMRPGMNGPRSLTRTVTDRPVVTSVTRRRVPNGSVRCAAVYPEIATVLGCTKSYAYKLVAYGLVQITREPAEDVMRLEMLRLDEMLSSIYAKAVKSGDPHLIERVLNIIDRQCRLAGLYRNQTTKPVMGDVQIQFVTSPRPMCTSLWCSTCGARRAGPILVPRSEWRLPATSRSQAV